MKNILRLCVLAAVAPVFFSGCFAPLSKAARRNDIPAMQRELDKGADINRVSYMGFWEGGILSWAARNRRLEAAKFLIEHGADVNCGTPLPLGAAAENNDTAMMQLLLARPGIMINAPDPDTRQTPLMTAAKNGNLEAVKLLVRNGADTGAAIQKIPFMREGDTGKTALMLAQEKGHSDIADFLRKAEAGEVQIVRQSPPGNPDEQARFDAAALKYLKAVNKPELPEDARKFAVQARAALKNASQPDQLSRVADLYRKALDIAPWWPDGHMNLSLTLAKLNYYDDAIKEMKRYLKLAPEAEDARAAQDKIYEWEMIIGK